MAPLTPPDHFSACVMDSPTKHLVGGVQIGSVFSHTLHYVVVTPGGGCQEGRLSFTVLNVHVAAGFTKGFGHRVIAVPGSAVQGGFFFLAKETGTERRRAR